MSAQVLGGAAAVAGGIVCGWRLLTADRHVRSKAVKNLRLGLAAEVPGRVDTAFESTAAVAPMERLTEAIRRWTPNGVFDNLNRKITRAGMASSWPVHRTLALKAILGAVGLVLGLLVMTSGGAGILLGLILPTVFFLLPDQILLMKANDRQKRIRVALPDTLDQITVCVEAGLGLEGAMARAAKTGTGPLADELVRTLQDVQLGVPRREAMRGLADRNDVSELKQFVQAIIQADTYGVPVGRVLRIHSNELREKRRQEAEEKAMKISIKMLFPIVTCILPTVFIVMVGPAIFQMVDSLGSRPQ